MLAITIINLLFLKLFFCQNNDEVNYYVNLIKEANQNAEKFAFPTDAREYLPKNNKLTSFGSFDFIIVGGGATGAVIASRLSENPNVSVLLLEAGQFGNNLTSIPGMGLPELILSRTWSWGYQSIPQKSSCLGTKNRKCVIPRGKGVGGTTLLNGLVNARGGSDEFNRWYQLGNPGWSYKDVLPFFKKVEHFEKNDPNAPVELKYHGKCGPMSVDFNRPSHPKAKVFLDAHREIGVQILDYNGQHLIGASPVQVGTKHGRRIDTGTGYLKPVRNRPNLKVLTHSYVSKITFYKKSPNSASGVIFSHNRQLYSVAAKKETIISAGAIGSPQLMMLSGIGPESHLKSLGISLVNNLEVGSKLKEHPWFFGFSIRTNLTNSFLSLRDQVKQFLNGKGTLSAAGNNFGLSFFSPENQVKNSAEFELELEIAEFKKSRRLTQKSLQWTDETYDSLWGDDFEDSLGLQIQLILLHEVSSGTIRLKSNNPYDYPLIDPNMLSDEGNKDLLVMYKGIQVVLKLLKTEAYQKINATLPSKPHPACKQYKPFSREYWFCALKQETLTVYHPVGTCPMGPDPRKGAVVNHELKVHGLSKLRVADASIFPTTLSGHPSFTCMMIGEMVSDKIKVEHELEL